MESYLRAWRQTALDKHQYESAIFVGDKLLALTNNDQDAFWLAQVHFSIANYTCAIAVLSQRDIIAKNPACRYLAGHCHAKQGHYEDALNVLGETNPVHLISSADRMRRKLQHVESAHPDTNGNPTRKARRSDRIDHSEDREHHDTTSIRYEAAMCYLRGLCYAKQNAFDRAKLCYKEAVGIDVQCFEAFDQLMTNKLMSPTEEWEFLESLDFDSVIGPDGFPSQEAAHFTKMLYTTRLSKYARPDEMMSAVDTLSTHYNMAVNPAVLLAKAEVLFNNCRFTEAWELTSSILQQDPYNFEVIPVHIACLYEEKWHNALFLLSHDLADTHPEQPATWLAVGTYYMLIKETAQARAYFSKASLMDPHCSAAWIGFAHTFAIEGEHDQAISAYSTAARLFQGTHLPQLFLGMENLCLGNVRLAREYFDTAYGMCATDPLLLNELGVTNFQGNELVKATRCFTLALAYAEESGANTEAWLHTHNNLAHTFRRSGRYQEALDEFDIVLRQGGRDAATLTAKGMVLLEMDDALEATLVLHEALAISPQEPMATELLTRALGSVFLSFCQAQ